MSDEQARREALVHWGAVPTMLGQHNALALCYSYNVERVRFLDEAKGLFSYWKSQNIVKEDVQFSLEGMRPAEGSEGANGFSPVAPGAQMPGPRPSSERGSRPVSPATCLGGREVRRGLGQRSRALSEGSSDEGSTRSEMDALREHCETLTSGLEDLKKIVKEQVSQSAVNMQHSQHQTAMLSHILEKLNTTVPEARAVSPVSCNGRGPVEENVDVRGGSGGAGARAGLQHGVQDAAPRGGLLPGAGPAAAGHGFMPGLFSTLRVTERVMGQGVHVAQDSGVAAPVTGATLPAPVQPLQLVPAATWPSVGPAGKPAELARLWTAGGAVGQPQLPAQVAYCERPGQGPAWLGGAQGEGGVPVQERGPGLGMVPGAGQPFPALQQQWQGQWSAAHVGPTSLPMSGVVFHSSGAEGVRASSPTVSEKSYSSMFQSAGSVASWMSDVNYRDCEEQFDPWSGEGQRRVPLAPGQGGYVSRRSGGEGRHGQGGAGVDHRASPQARLGAAGMVREAPGSGFSSYLMKHESKLLFESIPVCSGKSDEELMDFILAVDKVESRCGTLTPRDLEALLLARLKGEPRRLLGAAEVRSWAAARAKLLDNFAAKAGELQAELDGCTQGKSEGVSAYSDRLIKLHRRCMAATYPGLDSMSGSAEVRALVANDLIARYKSGLTPALREALDQATNRHLGPMRVTFDQLHGTAMRLERELRNKKAVAACAVTAVSAAAGSAAGSNNKVKEGSSNPAPVLVNCVKLGVEHGAAAGRAESGSREEPGPVPQPSAPGGGAGGRLADSPFLEISQGGLDAGAAPDGPEDRVEPLGALECGRLDPSVSAEAGGMAPVAEIFSAGGGEGPTRLIEGSGGLGSTEVEDRPGPGGKEEISEGWRDEALEEVLAGAEPAPANESVQSANQAVRQNELFMFALNRDMKRAGDEGSPPRCLTCNHDCGSARRAAAAERRGRAGTAEPRRAAQGSGEEGPGRPGLVVAGWVPESWRAAGAVPAAAGEPQQVEAKEGIAPKALAALFSEPSAHGGDSVSVGWPTLKASVDVDGGWHGEAEPGRCSVAGAEGPGRVGDGERSGGWPTVTASWESGVGEAGGVSDLSPPPGPGAPVDTDTGPTQGPEGLPTSQGPLEPEAESGNGEVLEITPGSESLKMAWEGSEPEGLPTCQATEGSFSPIILGQKVRVGPGATKTVWVQTPLRPGTDVSILGLGELCSDTIGWRLASKGVDAFGAIAVEITNYQPRKVTLPVRTVVAEFRTEEDTNMADWEEWQDHLDKAYKGEVSAAPFLSKFDLSHVDEEVRARVGRVLEQHQDAFIEDGKLAPPTPVLQYKVNVDPSIRPVYRSPFGVSKNHEEDYDEEIKKWLSLGVIEEANSPWAAPISMVTRVLPSGKVKKRLVCDLRAQNAHTLRDNFPPPNMQEILNSLHGANYISVFDVSNAYLCVEIHPESRDFFGLVTKKGTYRCKRMIFGAKNSGAVYCRLMAKVMEGQRNCKWYVDDLIVYTETLDLHLEVLGEAAGAWDEVKGPGQAALRVAPVRAQPINDKLHLIPDYNQYRVSLKTDPDFGEMFKELSAGRVESSAYQLLDGLLYKRPSGSSQARVCVPRELREGLMHAYHSAPWAGHSGYTRMYARIRERFYWPNMTKDIYAFAGACHQCALRKRGTHGRPAPLQEHVIPTRPFQYVSCDVVGPLPVSVPDEYRYIVTFICLLTKFTEAVPVRSETTEDVARAFVNQLVARWGVPDFLLTDNGACYISEMFGHVTAMLGVKHLRCTPLRPQAQGTIERSHRTLGEALSMYVNSRGNDWPEFVQLVAMSMRSAVNRATGETPYYLLTGFDMQLPYDLLTRPEPQRYDLADNMAGRLQSDARRVFRIVRERMRRAAKASKAYYDRGAKAPKFKVGDLVYLLEKSHKKGVSRKFRKRYSGPHRLEERKSLTTWRLKDVYGRKERTVHCDRLKIARGYDDILSSHAREQALGKVGPEVKEGVGARRSARQREAARRKADVSLSEEEEEEWSEESDHSGEECEEDAGGAGDPELPTLQAQVDFGGGLREEAEGVPAAQAAGSGGVLPVSGEDALVDKTNAATAVNIPRYNLRRRK
ncbi:Retrovirus-related Pol polyprotein from transposon 412 [Frankliniella fusca]|uniref:RNA-directed DNA polymerase n=1 Tax=Frankliniella fusca TaxID=407009 RepID=A0AAE1LK20_9NEOP|nr:Retrovirus-related Pol polyprotein from transposon 412 [Frankliniella fusca]